jgi:hypothetical protein
VPAFRAQGRIMIERPIFALTIRAEPGINAVRALRSWLKIGLRAFRLRCTTIEQRRNDMSQYSEKIARQKDSGLYRVSDFQNGSDGSREITHTIDYLMEDVQMFEREIDVLNFRDTGRQLQVNMTNGDTLIQLFGEDPEGWGGRQITLFLAPYGKEGKLGIRIKAAGSSAPSVPNNEVKTSTRPPLKNQMDDEIPF